MDFYDATDKKFNDFGSTDLHAFLDQDVFTAPSNNPSTDGYSVDEMDSDWFNSFFEDPILNDRMMSDAVQPTNLTTSTDHSYSIANNNGNKNGNDIGLADNNNQGKIIGSLSIKAEPYSDDEKQNTNLVRGRESAVNNLCLGSRVKEEPAELACVPVSMVMTQDLSSSSSAFPSSSSPVGSPEIVVDSPHNKSGYSDESDTESLMSDNSDISVTGTSAPTISMTTPISTLWQQQQQQQQHVEQRTANNVPCGATLLKNSVQQQQQTPSAAAVVQTQPAATTLILATHASNGSVQGATVVKQERLVLPKVKVEPGTATTAPAGTFGAMSEAEYNASVDHLVNGGGCYESLVLPPTPPGSTNGSDSDGCSSSAPSSPLQRLQRTPGCTTLHTTSHVTQLGGGCTQRTISFSQPFFTANQMSSSGVLVLTEEEKRTLASEGYPIPTKLPLTKYEEKNLKKIRRKIKNKISAQESRRKKKEYLETLERRVEAFSSENLDLKKKLGNLENSHRSLLSQLQKLQSLVGKVPRPLTGNSTQTGTCLMVLVLCFAVFLGGWSPFSLSVGYNHSRAMPTVHGQSPARRLLPGAAGGPVTTVPLPAPGRTGVSGADSSGGGTPSVDLMGPAVKNAIIDAYNTPNTRSRVLLSVREDELADEADQFYGPHTPSSGDVICTGSTLSLFLDRLLPRLDPVDCSPLDDPRYHHDNADYEPEAPTKPEMPDPAVDVSADDGADMTVLTYQRLGANRTRSGDNSTEFVQPDVASATVDVASVQTTVAARASAASIDTAA